MRSKPPFPSPFTLQHRWSSDGVGRRCIDAHLDQGPNWPYLSLHHTEDPQTTKPPTAPPSAIHGIPGETTRGGLDGAQKYHGAFDLKETSADKATQLHTSIIACSLALTHHINTPFTRTVRCIQSRGRTRAHSGTARRLTGDFCDRSTDFGEHLILLLTTIMELRLTAFLLGMCLLTCQWMMCETSVSENLDESISELNKYYVSIVVWIYTAKTGGQKSSRPARRPTRLTLGL